MLLLIGVTICCLFVNVQPQIDNQNPNYWNPGDFYYPQDGNNVLRTSRTQYGSLNVIPLATQRPVIEQQTSSFYQQQQREIEQQQSVQQQQRLEQQRRVEQQQRVQQQQRVEQQQRVQQQQRVKQQQRVQPQTGFEQQNRGQPQVQEQYENQQSNEGQQGALVAYKKGLFSITNFGLNLFRTIINTQPGNVVVSPFSIATVLALLQQGALGQTQDQISTALGLTPADSIHAFTAYREANKKHKSRNIFKTANNIFIAESFSLNPNFKQSAEQNFDSEVTRMNFYQPVAAANDINSWVASKTDNKINDLVSPDSLGPTTQLVLVNALYFKGIWDVPFRVQSTRDREFFLSNGQTKTVPFMRMSRYFQAGIDRTTNAKVLILPFELADYSMMFILPSELIGITDTLATMNSDRLISYNTFDKIEVAVEIPKFTIRADTDLETVLKRLGISEIFGENAELNSIGSNRAASPHISSAVHSALLSIDEQGGTAAASTAFAAVALSNDEPSLRFVANRPFIAVLWDNMSSLPLFMAKIEDPTQGN